MMSTSKMSAEKESEPKNGLNSYGVISLTPKQELFKKFKKLAVDILEIPENQLEQVLNDKILASHTVPVCIPLFTQLDDFEQFIKNNSEILINIMLSAWPFPIAGWSLINKNIELLDKLVEIKYFPLVGRAMTKPVKSTIDLAVTFAVPTDELINYIVESINSHKITLSEQEMIELDLITSTGVALITNRLEKSKNQKVSDYLLAVNDSKNYLAPLKEDIVKTLFYFYFKNKEEFPQESSNEFLNKWFTTKTYVGMYKLVH